MIDTLKGFGELAVGFVVGFYAVCVAIEAVRWVFA